MQCVDYCDLKRGELYCSFENLSRGKVVLIFELIDRKAVVTSFSIIKAHQGFYQIENDKRLISKEDFVTSLYPTDDIFKLSDDEIKNQIIIPNI